VCRQKRNADDDDHAPAGENAMVAHTIASQATRCGSLPLMTLMLPDRIGLRHRTIAMLTMAIVAWPIDLWSCRDDLRCCRVGVQSWRVRS
jgi:hypothetical protein